MSMAILASYLFVIDGSTMPLNDAIAKIDNMQSVVNWQTIMPDAAILVSALDTNGLNDKLKEEMPGQRYLIVKLESGKKNGWLPKSFWTFINNPRPVN